MNPSEFWEITPFELNIYAKAYYDRRIAEHDEKHDENIIHAYLISRWVWQKRVDVKKFIHSSASKNKKNMTDKEMFLQVKALNTVFGGEVAQSKRTS
jgi:hypothetical protein